VISRRVFGIDVLWPTLKVPQIIRKVASFTQLASGKQVCIL
jgi:hypothetical protein